MLRYVHQLVNLTEFLCARRASMIATACCQEVPKFLPPRPGTVNLYDHHILIRLRDLPPSSGALWPNIVERHPMVLQVFKALATNRSKLGDAAVKVTAYDFIQPLEQGHYKPSSTTCDVMVFPTGMRYSNLHSTALNELVRRIVSHTHTNGTDAIETAKLGDASVEEDISKKLVLLVCCHAARDARCGARGPPVARALMRSVHGRSLQSLVEVYATSHVGGHAYAANVLVYGARFPSDGDWFGGVHEDNAEEFLDALLGVEIGVDGGAGDKRLRQWWRGRLGLTKEQQLELWEAEGGIEEVPDGGSEEEDDFSKKWG